MAQPQTPVALAPPPASRRSIWLKWLAGLAVGAAFTWWSSRSWPLDKLFGGTLALVNGHHATQSTWAERLSLHQGLAVALQRPGTDGSLTVTWSLDLTALVLYFVILTAIHWLRVLRWRPLLEPHASVPLAVLNRAGAVGFMAVFLLPLRLGEFARPLMLARTHAGHAPVRFGAGLGVIALERVLDGLMVTGLLFAVLVQVPADVLARSPQVQLGGLAALAVFGSALGGLTATLVAREWTLRLTRSVLGAVSPALADKVIGLVTAFVDGLAMLQSPWHVAQFFLLTAVYWAINGAGLWVMAQGFGLDVPLAAGYAMMSCIVVGMMIPNSPGNVGSFWYFLLLPAGLWGVDQAAAPAVAFGLAVWLAQTVQTTAFGLLGSWADARALAQIAQSDVESPG